MDTLYLFTYERGSKECPKRYEEVTTGDAGEIKQRVGDAGASKNSEEAHLLHQLLHAVLGSLEAGHLLRVLQFLLELVELLLLLTRLRAGQPGGPSHEVGRELADGGARPPTEGLDPDLSKDGPHSHAQHGGHSLALSPGLASGVTPWTEDLSGVGRLGEVQAVTLVCGHGDGGDVGAEIEQEGVEPRAQADRAQDAQPHPPGAPG